MLGSIKMLTSYSTFTDAQLRKTQISFAIWHFFATFLVLYLASIGPYAIFKAIHLPIRQVLPVCLLFSAFLILNNLSLTHNNVGFYQLAKIMTTPSVVFFNYILFRRLVSRSKLFCVLVASGGVALANGVSAHSNPVGAIIAVLAFCATAIYQIWIGKTLQDLNISAPQLLCSQTWISSLLLVPFLPFFDSIPQFGEFLQSAMPRVRADHRLTQIPSSASQSLASSPLDLSPRSSTSLNFSSLVEHPRSLSMLCPWRKRSLC